MNFERLQMENELRRKKQIFEELFGEEWILLNDHISLLFHQNSN